MSDFLLYVLWVSGTALFLVWLYLVKEFRELVKQEKQYFDRAKKFYQESTESLDYVRLSMSVIVCAEQFVFSRRSQDFRELELAVNQLTDRDIEEIKNEEQKLSSLIAYIDVDPGH